MLQCPVAQLDTLHSLGIFLATASNLEGLFHAVRCIPNGCLAVGPGVRYQPPVQGQDLEAAPCIEQVSTLHCKKHCSTVICSSNKLSFNSESFSVEAPNELKIVAEKPSGEERKKYKRARTNAALYRAAALLWGKGVDMATAISIVESAMRDAGEVWFLPWDSSWISPKQNNLTLKLVDILSFVDTPGPFPTQMWYLRARCNTTQTYQIWKCHGVIVFHSDSFDGHLAKQKICAEHSAEIRPFVKQCSPAPCGSDWGPDWNKCRSSTQALHFHMPNSTFS